MHKVKVNDHFLFDIDKKGTDLLVNGTKIDLDIIDLEKNNTHVIFNSKSFNLEVISLDRPEKKCVVKVNGNIYTIKVEDQFDQLLKKLGMDNLATNKVAEIKAPMPGLVLSVIAVEGSEIKKGDNLLVLEAMKMENILKSSTDGMIKKILVKKGDKVEKNQVLVQFK